MCRNSLGPQIEALEDRTILAIGLASIANLTNPVALEFCQSMPMSLIVSRYFSDPTVLSTVPKTGGAATPYLPTGLPTFIPQEILLASVRPASLSAALGWTPNYLYATDGSTGNIWKIHCVPSPTATLFTTLSPSHFWAPTFDTSGNWGGDLIVVGFDTGQVWRIPIAGSPTTLLHNFGTGHGLEGVITVPNSPPTQLAQLAGKIVITAENDGGLFTIDSAGNTAFVPLSLPLLETLHIIPSGLNFFGADFNPASPFGVNSHILRANAADFTTSGYVGDILLVQEGGSNFGPSQGLNVLTWPSGASSPTVTAVTFLSGSATVDQWEHSTFADPENGESSVNRGSGEPLNSSSIHDPLVGATAVAIPSARTIAKEATDAAFLMTTKEGTSSAEYNVGARNMAGTVRADWARATPPVGAVLLPLEEEPVERFLSVIAGEERLFSSSRSRQDVRDWSDDGWWLDAVRAEGAPIAWAVLDLPKE